MAFSKEYMESETCLIMKYIDMPSDGVSFSAKTSVMGFAARFSAMLVFCLAALHGQAAGDPIDFDKARQLIERQNNGGTLSSDEKAYLDRARVEREKQQRAKLPGTSGLPGGADRRGKQRTAPARITPLTDLGAEGRYEGESGGLYGDGRNTPPEALRKSAEVQLAQIRPLNAAGQPADDGVIGFISLSMSNATQEFAYFKQVADASPLKSPRVTIIDCAQGGQAMAEWAPADAKTWQVTRERLATAEVSPQQVQVAWIKLANKAPTGSLEEHGRKLERDTLALLHNARALFPNLRIAYLGSRTFAGNATELAAQRGVGLNPEPYAFESAFPVRWLILRQLKGDSALALTRVPLLLWGPYFWADGAHGRKIDSLVWERSDFGPDGVHPSTRGRQKVSDQLLAFLTTDPLAKTWFSPK